MSFTNPDAFLLLLLIPIFMRLGWPRHAYRRRRDTLALVVRVLLVLLLILSLAGLQIRRDADKLAVVFLIDVSDSMDQDSQEQAVAYVRAAVETMEENDQAAVVLFGGNALVEHPMDELVNLRQIGSRPITINTDMSEAIRIGLALFPPDAAKRMVILSDGLETVGDATRAAELAAATGVQIDYVPYGIVRDKEVLVNSVHVPSIVSENEPFDLIVTIENKSGETTRANLKVLAEGELEYDQEVELDPGINRFVISPFQYSTAQFVDFRIIIEPLTAEGFLQNNELSAFTEVAGQPRILVITKDSGETSHLESALSTSGFTIEVMAPEDVPISLPALSAYRSIILANVPAADLTGRLELFQNYVRDLGRGLVVIGGPESYGVGGYFDTPLEETLPVEMRIKDQERIPKLTMLFVIDSSGSMSAVGPSGYSNLELAKEAIFRSMAFLNDYDRIGVVSFDHQAYWVVDIQDIGDAANRQSIESQVGSLRPGGGTDIFGGLAAADVALTDDPSTLKHIILLTDGGANPEGIPALVSRMNNNQITTSTVAVGQDYAPWLREVSARGGGNFHVAITTESIPAIFSAETVLATRSYIFEDPFLPTITASSPIIDGIDLASMPQLLGYVATTPKDTATVIFTGPEEDPILATWQYGLGRSVAFMSDATLRWGANWVNSWGDYDSFWNQVLRWTIIEGTNSNVDTWVENRGEEAVLVVDARDDDGNYLNDLDLDGSVVFPDREPFTPDFQQVAPGRYEATFSPDQEGAYFISILGSGENNPKLTTPISQTNGWVLSYSAEYSVSTPNARFLEEISRITKGVSLAGNPAAAFLHNLDHEEAAQPMWPYLLGLAACLLIIDIAVRRLVINKSDLEKLRETVSGWIGRPQTSYEESEASGRLSDLKQAKRRVGGSEEGEVAPSVVLGQATPRASANEPKPPRKPPAPPTAAGKDGTAASQLLKKKRERT